MTLPLAFPLSPSPWRPSHAAHHPLAMRAVWRELLFHVQDRRAPLPVLPGRLPPLAAVSRVLRDVRLAGPGHARLLDVQTVLGAGAGVVRRRILVVLASRPGLGARVKTAIRAVNTTKRMSVMGMPFNAPIMVCDA